jgi:hypothetical protein
MTTAEQALKDLSLSRLLAIGFRGMTAKPLSLICAAFVLFYAPNLLLALFWPTPPPGDFWRGMLDAWLAGIPLAVTTALFVVWASQITFAATGNQPAPKHAPIVLVIAASVLIFVVTIIGTLMLLVPGIIWSLITVVAIPVMAVDGSGIIQALHRSQRLTADRLGMILLFSIVWSLPVLCLVMGIDWGMSRDPTQADLSAYVVAPAVDALMSVLLAFFPAALYCELRRIEDRPNV